MMAVIIRSQIFLESFGDDIIVSSGLAQFSQLIIDLFFLMIFLKLIRLSQILMI